ncbi:hypothetical protein DIPPA_15174 [Diplonema papillatum]|nr:hypothetical protein DIPPA_15174 [Diplonema papillatum]
MSAGPLLESDRAGRGGARGYCTLADTGGGGGASAFDCFTAPTAGPAAAEARTPTAEESEMGILSCGIGHIFGRLPFTFGQSPASIGSASRPRESLFAYTCRAVLAGSSVLSVTVLVLWYLIPKNEHGTKAGVNKTDGLAPVAVQVLLVTWLSICNMMLQNLQKEWGHVREAARVSMGHLPRDRQSSRAEDRDEGSLRRASEGSFADDALRYDEDLTDLQAAQVIDLHVPLYPCPIDPTTGESITTAVEVIRRIAYRGCQAAKYSPLFKGIPVLPECGNYYKCLAAGIFLAGSQVLLIRLIYDELHSDDSVSTVAHFVYWLSTAHFFLAFFLFYSLLTLIVTSYRQQCLLLERFTHTLIQQRAARFHLPYFILNTTRNMQAWYAVRQFLLTHITSENALGTVLDPTFALLGLGVVSASTVLIVRQIFMTRDIDLFSAGCFNLLGASLVYVVCITFYGLRIQSHISSHAEILAHIQWEITRKWNSVLESLELAPPDARSAAAASRAQKLWILRRYTHGLMDTCHKDSAHPRILKASFSNMRWWVMIGLLMLNTVLFFAIRNNGTP